MGLEFREYVRIPFPVMAIQLTDENIEEVAKDLGRVGRLTGGQQYIDPYPGKLPKNERILTGSWITRVGVDSLRVYPSRLFKEQFIPSSDAWKELMGDLSSKREPDHPTLVDRALRP